MAVTSRCFAFHVLITQARIWSKIRQVYFIYPFLCRVKLGKSLQTCCVNFFFAKADILSESVFWNASFLQNKN